MGPSRRVKLCVLPVPDDPYGKSRNWKLKISNAADNADTTQSHNTRYRRMQEVNSLCVSKYVNICVTRGGRRWETLSSSLYHSVSPDTLQPVAIYPVIPGNANSIALHYSRVNIIVVATFFIRWKLIAHCHIKTTGLGLELDDWCTKGFVMCQYILVLCHIACIA